MKKTPLAGVLLLALAMTGVAKADAPAFDRPGIAFSPSVLVPGSFSWEQGLPDASRDSRGGVRTTLYSADTLLRAGIAPRMELQIGTSLYNRLDTETATNKQQVHGSGDSSAALKIALPTSADSLSWAMLGRLAAASGNNNFSAGSTQYALATAVGWAVRDSATLGLFAGTSHSKGETSCTLSPGISVAINNSIGTYLETGSTHTTHADSTHVAGGGMTWMVTPTTQLDLSADWGLTHASTRLQAGFGVSMFFN